MRDSRDSSGSSASICSARREGLPHKHEHRLDEDGIQPRHWLAYTGLTNGRHAKRHTTLPVAREDVQRSHGLRHLAGERFVEHESRVAAQLLEHLLLRFAFFVTQILIALAFARACPAADGRVDAELQPRRREDAVREQVVQDEAPDDDIRDDEQPDGAPEDDFRIPRCSGTR